MPSAFEIPVTFVVKLRFAMVDKQKRTQSCQTSKMESFAKIINGFQSLYIFAKSYILDVLQDSNYAFNPFMHVVKWSNIL